MQYKTADDYYSSVQQQYAPTPPEPQDDDTELSDLKQNQTILDIQRLYPDAVGWIVIEGTHIDYPFVQGKDNDEYLRRTMDKDYLVSGTLFLDYRNQKDFSDFTTILYGHHMKNGAMFGDLKKFRNIDFWGSNSQGHIYLANATYRLEYMAAIVVKSTDSEIYRFDMKTADEKQQFLDYVRENAEQYADSDWSAEDHYIILSSCIYDFENARIVVVARLAEE